MLRQNRGEAVLIDFGIAKEFVDLQTIYLSNSLGTELYKPIEPGNSHYWNNRGIAWSKLGKYEEAIRSYDRALAILPNNREISKNRLNAVRRKRQNQDCKIVE